MRNGFMGRACWGRRIPNESLFQGAGNIRTLRGATFVLWGSFGVGSRGIVVQNEVGWGNSVLLLTVCWDESAVRDIQHDRAGWKPDVSPVICAFASTATGGG